MTDSEAVEEIESDFMFQGNDIIKHAIKKKFLLIQLKLYLVIQKMSRNILRLSDGLKQNFYAITLNILEK